MKGADRPPRVLERLASLALPDADRNEALGDLHEEYGLIASRSGRRRATRWYTGQLMRALAARLRPSRPGVGIGRDARAAFRSLRRAPRRTAMLSMILAGGIGASTVIFAAVDQVVLRPLPYPDSDEIHSVWNVYPAWAGDPVLDSYWRQVTLSWDEYIDIRDGVGGLRGVAAYGFSEVTVASPENPERIWGGLASANLFTLLGIDPEVGRLLAPGEEGPDAPTVAVVSYGFWRDRLAADPDLTSARLRIDGRHYDVVGVLPEDFSLRGQSPFGAVSDPELWVPTGSARPLGSRGDRSYEVIARASSSVGLAEIGTELTRLVWGDEPEEGRSVRLTPRHAEEVRSARAPLSTLLAAALLMLLVVSATIATLRIGNVSARGREWSTRLALGAARSHLRSQLLAESLILGAFGLGGGSALARIVLGSWMRVTPPDLLLGVDVRLDARALAFAATCTLWLSLAGGWLPLLRVGRAGPGTTNHRGATPDRGAGALQRGLLTAQIAFSMVLLSGAALFTRSMVSLNAVDPGFIADDVVTLRVEPAPRAFESVDAFLGFHERLAQRLAALPGVLAVSATTHAPFGDGLGSTSFGIGSRTTSDDEKAPEALRRSVTPGFFELMGIPVLEGRPLGAADGRGDPPVTVVSAALAEAYWPDSSPIGDAIVRDGRRFDIVGIVGDVHRSGLARDPEPTFYLTVQQEPALAMDVVLRLGASPAGLASSIRAAVWAEDPTVPLRRLERLDDRVRESMSQERFRSLMTSFFGVSAALLAALGLFGVAVQTSVRRTREVGIRMALGATRTEVSRLMIGRELRVVWLGVGCGLLIVLGLGRTLSGLLFGIPPHDPVALLLATACLVTVAVIAVWLPARRAARLGPARSLEAP